MALEPTDSRIALLYNQIATSQSHLDSLKQQLVALESAADTRRHLEQACRGGFPAEWIDETLSAVTADVQGYHAGPSIDVIAHSIRQDGGSAEEPMNTGRWPLNGDEYRRYGRQMIMKEVGLHGQLRLKNARVLVVGCGGLGCPAAAYLAGAGVGTLGLVDGDVVEASNLHRQIAHSTSRVGKSKVESLVEYCRELNPLVTYEEHPFPLSPSSALPLFYQYDLVLDCTDHPKSRYLISDACVLAGKPLVSASALKTEGQLIILNNPPCPPGDLFGGPCYRCIFPKPPPADSVLSCGEGGVLGPVVGVMGVLQALEAIKLIIEPKKAAESLQPGPKASMLIFSAFSNPQFRSIRMRSRHADCRCCSAHATITSSQLNDGSLDYAAFCGLTTPLDVLPPTARITAGEFAQLPRDGSNILIDVRDETQYAMCALRGSINVPWQGSTDRWLQRAVETGLEPAGKDLFVVCRFGNDSQLAVKALHDRIRGSARVRDIRGGFRAWREEVDQEWPDY